MARELKSLQYLGYAFAAGKVISGGIGFFQKRAAEGLKTATEANHRKLTEQYLAANPDNKETLSTVDSALQREAVYMAKTGGQRSGISTLLGLKDSPIGPR